MRIRLLAAVFCSSLASALSIPSSSPNSVNDGSRDILTAVEVSSSNEVSLRFEAPCYGCFVDSDIGLIFNVVIRRAAQACGEGHIFINRQQIEWSNTAAKGAVSISAAAAASDLGYHDLEASWTAACIADEAQILSLTIHQVGQNNVNDDSGFTISFKQAGQPEVLRLVGEPIDISQTQNLANQWTRPDRTQPDRTQPDRKQPVALAPTRENSAQSYIDDEFLQLEALNSQKEDLQKLIGEKKHRIHQLLRDDFRELYSTITKCDSLKCIFQTIMSKIADYARIVSVHCLHHHPVPQEAASSEGIKKQEQHSVTSAVPETPAQSAESTPSTTKENKGRPLILDHNELPSTSATQHGHPSHSAIPSQSRQASPAPTPPHNGNGFPSPTPSHNTTSLPSQYDHHHLPLYYSLLVKILSLLLLITILGGFIFLTLFHFRPHCASLRHRVSCLASREERRTRRAYRRAARQHAWRNWWNRYRRPTCTDDYEEKRTLLLEQESILEDAMQHQIHHLTTEQETDSEMLRAEEGRGALHNQANIHMPFQQQSRHLNAVEVGATSSLASSSSSSTTTQVFRILQHSSPHSHYTIPPGPSSPSSSSFSLHSGAIHHAPPPSYDQELGDDIDVVDGFTFSPTFGASQSLAYPHTHMLVDGYVGRDGADDTSPDSSVVDCSPRMSFDTGRSGFILTSTATTTAMGKEGH